MISISKLVGLTFSKTAIVSNPKNIISIVIKLTGLSNKFFILLFIP